MKRGIDCLRGVFIVVSLLFAASVHAQSPQDILTQYVADLRKNPDDAVLREKIIKHVRTMNPAPAIPEDARRHYVMGRTLLKDAKSPQEANEAAGEFRKALAVAPWYPEANRYCGVALGIANRHDEAIAMLKLYIATDPPDARDAQDEIYAMEAKKTKAARERTEEKTRAKVEEKKKGLKDLAGKWRRKEPYDHNLSPYDDHAHYREEIRGEELYLVYVIDVPYWDWRKGEERVFFIANKLEGTIDLPPGI